MKKSLATLLLLLCIGLKAEGQTQANTISWQQPEALPVVQLFVYQLKLDAAPATTITPTCIANVAPLTGTSCSAPIATFTTSGVHTVVLTASNGFGSSSTSISGSQPNNAIGLKVIVTITIP